MITPASQGYTLPGLEMIDSSAGDALVAASIPAAPVVDQGLQDQIFSELRLASANSTSSEELVKQLFFQAYQSVGFGPVLEVMKRYAC